MADVGGDVNYEDKEEEDDKEDMGDQNHVSEK